MWAVGCALTRGPVMSPGAIGARERVPAVQALRPLRAVSVRMLHSGMLQPTIQPPCILTQHGYSTFELCFPRAAHGGGADAGACKHRQLLCGARSLLRPAAARTLATRKPHRPRPDCPTRDLTTTGDP
ncbi:unnamed protein product [Chrysodeixis includens]|uniref:Uncharacterized protein n=1 Tax=Chrysodeixis includens TaxID=689277 RepID=A0A9N8L2V7_CHRIL|nr:unnamed protein product [Chrysodeixis includens]